MSQIMELFWHKHPVEYTADVGFITLDNCLECDIVVTKDAYTCDSCSVAWHAECVPISLEKINFLCHPNHPLKLHLDGPPNFAAEKCHICEQKLNSYVYHCSHCGFSVDARCAKNPPPLMVDAPKCHEHALTLMAREVSFTCNACGTPGERIPYVCSPCALMFHKECIKLPRVININRHDHRLYHTYSIYSLRDENRVCEVCRHKVEWRYGAYFCLKCPSYVVHSKCATRKDVWDGVELEGVPEEVVDIEPFKVISYGVINHFSHREHNLKFIEEVRVLNKRILCEACVHPIYFENHYSCMECPFLLHETCANLPLQKRHGLFRHPLSLLTSKGNDQSFFSCAACLTPSNGFRYAYGEEYLDVKCASISWYRDDKCHPHSLFLTTLDEGTCGNCNQSSYHVLRCIECEFSLDFGCATLPKMIKHRCDDHFLLLRFGENAMGNYWCEICETKVDPKKWFYTCDDCLVVCHVQCVVGEFPNAKPGVVDFSFLRLKLDLVPNHLMSRPKCNSCDSHCRLPNIIKNSTYGNTEEYYCDYHNCWNIHYEMLIQQMFSS